jgi:uncharacterized membrane protein
MVVRIVIALFASVVAGLSYLTGLGRLMTALLIGFGAFCSFLLAVLFFLPINPARPFIPVYSGGPAWPYVLTGVVLTVMVPALYYLPAGKRESEQVSAQHFKYLLGGAGGYLTSFFVASVFWFPSDEDLMQTAPATMKAEMVAGTLLFLLGVCISCYFFYLSTKGNSERHPDLMRRFVLGFFTFCQFDKMPLLAAYLLIYSPESLSAFSYTAALAMTAYIPVGIFLLRTSLDSIEL